MLRQLLYATVWFFLFCAGPVAAAEISVAPGNGTLAAAVASAVDGDTLILTDGAFYGDVTVDRSLMIRPVQRSTDTLIDAAISIAGEGISVTLQGLKFSQNVILGQAASVRLLENTWVAGNVIASAYRTDEGDGSLYIVGNQFGSGSIEGVRTDNAYIAGNVLLNGAITTSSSVWIVGNDVRIAGRRGIQSAGGGATVRILGNRVECSSSSSMECLYSSASSSLIAGNIVAIEDTNRSIGSIATQIGIQATGSGLATILNNVVRGTWANATRYGDAISVSTGGATVSGNIVVDYVSNGSNGRPIYVLAPTAEVTYNLCFNNSRGCPGGEGNLNADPLFVDLESYELSAGSAAIDAGPPDYARADLDRTRNDMGAHGGPWSIGQYDAQRDPYNYAPYVYPLIKVDAAPGGGTLEIEALGVAKLR